jgi:hypothetical protein
MTKGEYWILDVVLEWRETIAALEPDDIEMLELSFNRKGHGLSHDQLLDTLHSLFQRGDIIAEYVKRFHPESSLGLFVPSRREIEKELLSRRNRHGRRHKGLEDGYVYYGLTAQGGAKWEAVSHPDWNLFVDRYGVLDEQDRNWEEIASCNKSLVEQYLENALSKGIAIPETVEWEELVPWEATYWKVLPRGYWVRYRSYDGTGISDHSRPVWYTSYLNADMA